MDDLEKAQRLEALMAMFLGYGTDPAEERLRWYANTTRFIPLGLLAPATQFAAMESPGGFAPGPGDIVKAALRLDPQPHSQSGHPTLPKWHQKATQSLSQAFTDKPQGPKAIVETLDDALQQFKEG